MSNTASVLIIKEKDNYYVDVVCNTDIIQDKIGKEENTDWIKGILQRMQEKGVVLYNANKQQAVEIAKLQYKQFIREIGCFPEYGIEVIEI